MNEQSDKTPYTNQFLKAIQGNPKKFEEMLESMAESPYQSKYGHVWINQEHAQAICSDVLLMALCGELEDTSNYEQLEKSTKNLIQIMF